MTVCPDIFCSSCEGLGYRSVEAGAGFWWREVRRACPCGLMAYLRAQAARQEANGASWEPWEGDYGE